MKQKRIEQVVAELSEGERLLKNEKKAVRHAKGKIAKDNKVRALKVMKKAVVALADQEKIIKRGGQIPLA